MWQLAPSVQNILQPPGHESMTHSAPAPAHRVVQPPVAHVVAQSEPEVHVELQFPDVQLVLQVAASQVSAQPPAHVRLQEAFWQTPVHKAPGQPRSQLAFLLQSKEQGEVTVPLQAKLQVWPSLHLQASLKHESGRMPATPDPPEPPAGEPEPAAPPLSVAPPLPAPPPAADPPERPALFPIESVPPAPLPATPVAAGVPPSAGMPPRPKPAVPADADDPGDSVTEPPQPNDNVTQRSMPRPNAMNRFIAMRLLL